MGNNPSVKVDVSRIKCESDCDSTCCIYFKRRKKKKIKQKEQPALELNLEDQVLSSNDSE